jgi:hypothetical protein
MTNIEASRVNCFSFLYIFCINRFGVGGEMLCVNNLIYSLALFPVNLILT